MRALRRTQSLCPHCLRVVEARYIEDAFGQVFFEKNCPEHGVRQTLVWAVHAETPHFSTWVNSTPPNFAHPNATPHIKGCPFDCGLCPDHAQQTCCALIEVTQRCNLRCPVCYASSNGNTSVACDPTLDDIAAQLDTLFLNAGSANVQLSGGEPTVRDDVPDIIRLARERGFTFVQLNTNGLRLGQDPAYAHILKEAGLNVVYLQWDGLRETTMLKLRGASCLAFKERALQHCQKAGLSVVLVATLVRGINDDELGDLLRKAVASGSHVRGLHVQPVASFGRTPWEVTAAPQLTLPDVLSGFERQTKGMIKASHFHPPNSEHALCSFSAVYRRTEHGTLENIPEVQGCCCGSDAPQYVSKEGSDAVQARTFVARHWSGVTQPVPKYEQPDGFDTFLQQSGVQQRFTLSGMLFQDANTVDLDRLRRCHIHVVTQDNRLIPFCAYNLTSINGYSIYRGVC